MVRAVRTSTTKLLCLFRLCLLWIIPSSAIAADGQVALTFDDLPALTILPDQRYVDYLNATILRKLRHHQFPAIGFVNEAKIDDLARDHQIANLERWLNAGMELGNHTFSHSSLNSVGPKAYIDDIVRGELVTKALLRTHGQRMRFFRPPYLETGETAAVRNEVQSWLVGHGYNMAPVTIDAEDWEFAEPYDDAIAKRDPSQQQRIREEYLAYTGKRIAWSQNSARALFGRDIAHVMLLHCTRLNADTFEDLAKLLRRAHLKPVTLETALQDPVYQQPDRYAGSDGVDWLERWAAARNVDLPEQGSEEPPADIGAAYDRVDNDRR
jgi:peptidoglycan/xylan/chitin deacetylase (PgdA/CDA1 family)